MRATFTQDQRDIEKTVRTLLEGEATGARQALESGWSAPACDATLLSGFSVLGVPERAGGVGSGLIDLLVAVEAVGASLVPSRFPSHAAAVQLLAAGGEVDEAALEGRRVLTAAIDAPGAPGWPQAPEGSEGSGGSVLRRILVPHLAGADAVVVATAATVGEAAPARLRVVERRSFDPSVPLSDLEVDAADLSGTRPAGTGCARATLVTAAQLSGVAQGAIDLAAGYARTREQFGRAIGSFQAIAFQLAEAVAVRKAAWDLTLYAAWAVENERPDGVAQVHAAKAAAGRAAVFAAERCIQVHGGMGITQEADPHLYLRRAMVLDAVHGSAAWHRRRAGSLRIAARTASDPHPAGAPA